MRTESVLTTVGEALKIDELIGKKVWLVGTIEMTDGDSVAHPIYVNFSDKSAFSGCWLHKDIQTEIELGEVNG